MPRRGPGPEAFPALAVPDVPASPPLAEELTTARRLALAAGEILIRHRTAGIRPGKKLGGEIVTVADLDADRLIRQGLAATFPKDAILSEEAEDDPRRARTERTWIVDPIDGTQDYALGGDEHAISIGLCFGGRPVLGVVHNPFRRELFAGTVEGLLTLGADHVRVTDVRRVADARLTVSPTEWSAGVYARARSLPIRPVSSSAYKLARVAAGLDDGTFWIWPRKQWDVCAGVALVLAGGGVVSLLDGSAIAFDRREVQLGGGVVAAGAPLHALLQRELAALGFVP